MCVGCAEISHTAATVRPCAATAADGLLRRPRFWVWIRRRGGRTLASSQPRVLRDSWCQGRLPSHQRSVSSAAGALPTGACLRCPWRRRRRWWLQGWLLGSTPAWWRRFGDFRWRVARRARCRRHAGEQYALSGPLVRWRTAVHRQQLHGSVETSGFTLSASQSVRSPPGQFQLSSLCHISFASTAIHCDFYARKQLLLSARLSHRSSVCLSACLSVCLSHGWISQKRCKLGSPNLHCRLRGRL